MSLGETSKNSLSDKKKDEKKRKLPNEDLYKPVHQHKTLIQMPLLLQQCNLFYKKKKEGEIVCSRKKLVKLNHFKRQKDHQIDEDH